MVLGRLAFQGDEHDREDQAADGARVEDRHLPGEQPAGPVAGDAPPDRTGRQADEVAELVQRPPGVLLASSTMDKADWANATVLDGDLVQEVARLKQQPGRDILTYGFGPVAQTLLQHGLLDEVRLWVHPVLVGAGSLSDMLFREGNTARLELVDTRPLPSGIVIFSYRPAVQGPAR